jgi:hypothetical protein
MILKLSSIVIIDLIATLSFLYHKSTNTRWLALTEPDHLKSAAEYLLQVARNSDGRRYRKQPKIEALRQYKEEILEAHRSGLSVHRIGGGQGVARCAPPSESHGKGIGCRSRNEAKSPGHVPGFWTTQQQSPGGGICEAIADRALPGCGRLAAIAAIGARSWGKNA